VDVVRHITASVFVFNKIDGRWYIGLIQHPRFERWMIPGGHVEPHENQAQTAVREVLEETGLAVRLLSPAVVSMPVGQTYPVVTTPLWIVEEDVPPEPREPSPHIHVDFLYVAVVRDPSATPHRPAHEFRWFTEAELERLGLFDNTALLCKRLFGAIDELTSDHAAR
jgi:8-oxo-dGTP pyrophosphatase MutT (NUDIX family)